MKTIDKPWRSSIRIGMLFLILVTLSQCGKDDEPELQAKKSDKQITSFVFLLTNNAIANNVVAIIDEENKTITSNMPAGTDVTGLLPDVEIPVNATVTPSAAQDFTNPVVYTVTAEDGSKVAYTADVKVAISQRQILQAILDANPENTINWNLSTTADLGTLEGITLDVEGNIIKLALSKKNLIQIPVEIIQLTNLDTLILYENKLISLPEEIGQLAGLTFLDLRYNQLSALPSQIGQLTNMTFLGLVSNNLSSLPAEIGRLTRLDFLDLQLNKLASLPVEIGQLTSLTGLYLNNNQLSSIPAEIGQMAALRFLTLEKNALVSLPMEISHLSNLIQLYLNDNQLISVPSEIGKLTSLIDLQLHNNQLTSLPEEIGFLNQLSLVSVNNNSFNVIPQCICNIQDFKTRIDVFVVKGTATCATTSQKDALISIYSANPGNTLGWGVDNFPGVDFTESGIARYLTMNNKNLTRLPDNIDQLNALEGLILSDNALGSLPAKIGNINSLIVIAAFNTNITTVPSSFGLLTNLALLQLEDNPITSIPSSVCDQQVSNGGILTILADPGEGCN